MLKKWWLGPVMALVCLAVLVAPVHASTDLGNVKRVFYVKVKKPIFTGQYTKVNGHRGHRLATPKGTVLRVVAVRHEKDHPSQAILTRGLISYRLRQRIDLGTGKYRVKHFNTTYFKPCHLKLPISEYQFQAGRATINHSAYYKPIFNLTMDGYLQYYTSARLKHAHIQTTWLYGKQPTNGSHNPLSTIKPSIAVKINKTVAKGHHFYLYFRQPVSGLKAKKVHVGYRLLINELKDHTKTWHQKNDFYSLMWRDYHVGGQPFYFLWGAQSNDPGYLK